LLKFIYLPHIRYTNTATLHPASIIILFQPSHRCICLKTQGRQLERCLCRSIRGTDGNKDRKRGREGYHTILNTSSRWIDSFAISAYVSDTLDHCYSPDLSSRSSETPHKEEGVKICKFDEDDRQRIRTELVKFSHLLDTEMDVLYNTHNG